MKQNDINRKIDSPTHYRKNYTELRLKISKIKLWTPNAKVYLTYSGDYFLGTNHIFGWADNRRMMHFYVKDSAEHQSLLL